MANYSLIKTHISMKSRVFNQLCAITIMLHGYGDNADNFSQIGKYFAEKVPNRVILIPHATIQLPYGYAWFQIDDLHKLSPETIKDNLATLDDILTQYLNAVHEQYNCSHIEIVGFSQGAMLAMRSIYLCKNIKLILSASGIFLPKQSCDVLANDVEMIITHGKHDAVVPYQYVIQATGAMTKLGIKFNFINGEYGHSCEGLFNAIDLLHRNA